MTYFDCNRTIRWGVPFVAWQLEALRNGEIFTVLQFNLPVCRIIMCPNGTIQELN